VVYLTALSALSVWTAKAVIGLTILHTIGGVSVIAAMAMGPK